MEHKERALAHIEKIEWIKPISGADNIELVGVLGWVCIAKKGDFNVGDQTVYIEIDSKCPSEDKRFKFLESKGYKIKTMKLGKFGVISQGLAMPVNLFSEIEGMEVGTNITEILNITYSSKEDIKRKSNHQDKEKQYQNMITRHSQIFSKPFIKKVMKYHFGRRIMFTIFGKQTDKTKKFPEWIKKTDETRIENAPFYLGSKDIWSKTEKLDGTSCTFAIDKDKKGKCEFIVCSRNVRQQDRNQECYHKSNIYWELAEKYNLQTLLNNLVKANDYNRVVIQGEGVGFIQGNPYKLNENDLYIFNLIIDGVRVSTELMVEFCKENNLKHVPVIDYRYRLPDTMEEVKLEADGSSKINPKVKREGFVYRSMDGQQSFKNVSREFLLKHS